MEISEAEARRLKPVINQAKVVKAVLGAGGMSSMLDTSQRQISRLKPVINQVTSEIKQAVDAGEAEERGFNRRYHASVT